MAGVQINLTPERAQELQNGLSDIACWARGFVTALPPDDRLHYAPMGIEEVRDLNIILKGAIGDYEAHTLTPEERENARLRAWLYRMRHEIASTPQTPVLALLMRAITYAIDGRQPPDSDGLEDM